MNQTQSQDFNIAISKLALLYQQSRVSAALNVLLAVLLVAVLWGKLSDNILLVWLVTMVVMSLFRFCLSVRFFSLVSSPQRLKRWQYYYYITLIFVSSTWGFGTGIMLLYLPPLYQTVIYFFLIGIGGGFLVAHSVYRLHIVTFIPLLLCPAIFYALLEGVWSIKIVGFTTLVFMLAGINATQILTKMLHQHFLLTQELGEAKLKAEKLANIDSLTSLNNRRSFLGLSGQQLNLCKRINKPITMLMADVDNFKSINDTYGHEVGDKALIHIADLLREQQRISDISARLGGEEFVVFLANTEQKDALVFAERLRKTIETRPLVLDKEEIELTVSIGLASNVYDIEQLLAKADKAMYRAKQLGKNRVEMS